MSEVKVNNGNIEDALKRFKRQCARNGVCLLYTSPSPRDRG